MSKSKGNIVPPWDVLDTPRRGRLPLVLLHLEAAVGRLPLLGRDGRRVGAPVHAARSGTPTASTSLYANVNGVEHAGIDCSDPRLPTWTAGSLSRLQADRRSVAIDRLDDYDTTTAGRAIAALVDELSNWYVRRSRRRFWDGGPAPRSGRCTVPGRRVEAARAADPFVADEIYEHLDGSEPSVHLCDFPEPASAARRASSSGRWRSPATRSSWAARRARRRS